MKKNPQIPANINRALQKMQVDYLVYVPATGMSEVYDHFEEIKKGINVSREEEGVAVAAGLALGGKLPVLMVQQSGVGNMMNSFIGLADAYDIYFPIIVLDRGLSDENPVQAHSSRYTTAMIEAIDTPVHLDFSYEKAIDLFEQSMRLKRRWFISPY